MFKCWKLTLVVSENVSPLVSDFLLGFDTVGVARDTAEDDKSKEVISAYFPVDTDLEPVVEGLRKYTGFLRNTLSGVYVGSIGVEQIDSSSWEVWKQQLKTVRAGSRIVIVPPWEEYIPRGDDIVIEINPSMAFGTGHHETTRLCIQAIEDIARDRGIKRMLDVGCGSGVLAISAVKLGAEEAFGLDPDFVAVCEAIKNARRNLVQDKIRFFCGYIESVREKFDLVVANIYAEVIILIRQELRARLIEEGGKAIVSGIPFPRREEVVVGLEKAGFVLERELQEGEWMAFVFGVDKK